MRLAHLAAAARTVRCRLIVLRVLCVGHCFADGCHPGVDVFGPVTIAHRHGAVVLVAILHIAPDCAAGDV